MLFATKQKVVWKKLREIKKVQPSQSLMKQFKMSWKQNNTLYLDFKMCPQKRTLVINGLRHLSMNIFLHQEPDMVSCTYFFLNKNKNDPMGTPL